MVVGENKEMGVAGRGRRELVGSSSMGGAGRGGVARGWSFRDRRKRRVRLGQLALIGGSRGGRGCLVLAPQPPPPEEEVEVEEE